MLSLLLKLFFGGELVKVLDEVPDELFLVGLVVTRGRVVWQVFLVEVFELLTSHVLQLA